jgi:hypothetical protein
VESVSRRGGRHALLGLVTAAVLTVAVHAGLAAGVLAIPQWAALSVDAILLIVLVKVALIAAHVWRRHRAASRAR